MISIIIPTYNRAYLIDRTIASIRNQTYVEWECLIVDDHSTDNTESKVLWHVKNDNRFSFHKNIRKKGAPGARNTGLLAAKGEYIVLFDSDNIMHPRFLETVYEALIKNCVDICSSFSTIIDEQSGENIGVFAWYGYGKVHSSIMKRISYFDNSSTIIKKSKLIDIGLLDEECPSYQEWDTHIRLSNISTYYTVKEELIDYYRGGADTISKSVVRDILGILYILNKFRMEFIKSFPFTYFVFSYDVYKRIHNLNDDQEKKKMLLKQYHKCVNSIFQIGIYLFFISKLLRRKLRFLFFRNIH